MSNLIYEWVDGNREPKHPPNPAYPNGIDLNLSTSARPSCSTALPCPATRCGYYVIHCPDCGARVMVTTAGRLDDPRSVKINCRNGRP